MAPSTWRKSVVSAAIRSLPTFPTDNDTVVFEQSPETAHTPAPTDLFSDQRPPKPLPIVVRATNGKSKDKRKERVKLSTVVEADALETFFQRYAEICKGAMVGLKKRDRSKTKAKQKAKKKKDIAAPDEVKTA